MYAIFLSRAFCHILFVVKMVLIQAFQVVILFLMFCFLLIYAFHNDFLVTYIRLLCGRSVDVSMPNTSKSNPTTAAIESTTNKPRSADVIPATYSTAMATQVVDDSVSDVVVEDGIEMVSEASMSNTSSACE